MRTIYSCFSLMLFIFLFSCTSEKENRTKSHDPIILIEPDTLYFSIQEPEHLVILTKMNPDKEVKWHLHTEQDWIRTSKHDGLLSDERDTLKCSIVGNNELKIKVGVLQIDTDSFNKKITVYYYPYFNIIIGKGIDSLLVGTQYKNILARFGKPSSANWMTDGSSIQKIVYTYAEYKEIGLLIFFEGKNYFHPDSIDKAIAIRMSPPFCGKTDKGIGIGASKSKLISRHGMPDEIVNNYYNYQSPDISFEIINDRIRSISVADSCFYK